MEKERIFEILKENSVCSDDNRLIYESDVEYFVNELHQEFEAEKQELVEALKKTYEVLMKNIDKYSYENTTDIYVLLAENNILIKKHKGNE